MFAYLQRISRFAVRERRARDLAARLPELERTAVAAGLEFERAELYWPLSAVVSLTVVYGVASAIWGLAIRVPFVWCTVGGVALGLALVFTVCASPIFAKLEPTVGWHDQLKDRQAFIGVWVKIAIVAGGAGLIVLAVRMAR